MASSYNTIGLELMATGENAGTWGSKTNNNLDLIEQAIAGYEAVTITDSTTTTLVMSNAALSNARNMIIKIATITLTGATTVTIPDGIEKFYIFDLTAVTGVTNLTIKTASGTGFTAGEAKIVAAYSDGTNLNEIALDTLGGTIGSAQIADNAIISAKISANQVTTAKIADNAITTAKVSDSQITNAKLGNKSITINGSPVNLGSSVTISAGTSWSSTIYTTTFSAAANTAYWVNTSGGTFTATLPSSPNAGDEVVFSDYYRTFATNNLTLNLNSLNYQGGSSPTITYNVDGQSISLVYSGATQGWIPYVENTTNYRTPPAISGQLLLVAGGGSGGNGTNNTGGGGAGGYREVNPHSFYGGEVYTITVGAGGSQSSGSDSSIASSFTGTVPASGGGMGGNASTGNSKNGGSGGGSKCQTGGAFGTGNTPPFSPPQGNPGGATGNHAAGGGGGAGGSGGGGGSNTVGGPGGAGSTTNISGSPLSYAGGGGGAGDPGGSGAAGGGSGKPQSSPGSGGGADVNSGSGGGGAYAESTSGGNGGSGIVYLRIPTADYTGTYTGTVSVNTDGSDTILQYTGPGTYSS
jgi:hypothetical protein